MHRLDRHLRELNAISVLFVTAEIELAVDAGEHYVGCMNLIAYQQFHSEISP